MKTQANGSRIPSLNRLTLPAGIKKAISYGWRIGFVALLVLLVTGLMFQSTRANAPAQTTGYWRFVGITNVPDQRPDTARTIYKNEISDNGGHLYEKCFDFGATTSFAIRDYTTSWSITSPASLDKLMPGDTVEATASCTDISQANSLGLSNRCMPVLGGVNFEIVGPGVGGQAGIDLLCKTQKTTTATGKVIIPDFFPSLNGGDKFVLRFGDQRGYSNRNFEWVPETAPAAPAVDVPPLPSENQPVPPAPSTSNTCTATLEPQGDIVVGREYMFRANVVDSQGAPQYPTIQSWFYNQIEAMNHDQNGGSSQWDGTETVIEYRYVCPVNGQTLSATYTIPAQNDGSGWLVTVGVMGAAAAASAAAAVVGGMLIINSGKKGAAKKNQKGPQPIQYVLQLDKRSLEVKIGDSVPLNIQAWRINPAGGPPVLATEAVIRVTVPPTPSGLVVSPPGGNGALTCFFSIPKPIVCDRVMVAVTASANGLHTSSQVEVRVVPVYELQLQWQDPAKRPQPSGSAWARAIVKATPPDPISPPEQLTGRITFSVQGPNSNLIRLQPPVLKNKMQWVQVFYDSPPQGSSVDPGTPTLVAQVQVQPDKPPLLAKLNIDMDSDLVLDVWAQGKKQADVKYSETSDPPGWFFGGITVYFHTLQDENKPVDPPFKSNIQNPEFLIEPADILELRDNGEDRPGWIKRDVTLRPGVDLEKYFGPDLTEQKAQIRLTVTVTPEPGKPYTSTVIYQICPTVELVALQCEKGLMQEVKGHQYTNLDLGPLEFLTDGEDKLTLAVFYRRTDQPFDLSRPLPYGRPISAHIDGQDSIKYQAGSKDAVFEPDNDLPGLYYLSVKSINRMLATQPRLAGELNVIIEAKLVDKPPSYQINKGHSNHDALNENIKLRIQPVFPAIHLWVVPSHLRGYSIAGAMVSIARPKQALEPWIDAPALVFSADCFNFDLQVMGRVPKDYFMTAGGKLINSDWLQTCLLQYNGLNWGTVKTAWGHVYCRFGILDGAIPGETATFELNINSNMCELMAAFTSDIDSLDINNPEFSKGGDGLLELYGLMADARGAWYNIRYMAMEFFTLGNFPPDGHPYEKYLCSNISIRLIRYFVARRNGVKDPGTALIMNGIEFSRYGFYVRILGAGAHSWIGVHLSGTALDQEPIFMDSWWRQVWDDTASQDDYGYIKQNIRVAAVSAFVVVEVILLYKGICRATTYACEQAGITPPSLGEVWEYLKAKIWGKPDLKPSLPDVQKGVEVGKGYLNKGLETLKKGWDYVSKNTPSSVLYQGAIAMGEIMTAIQPDLDVGGLIEDKDHYKNYLEIHLFEKFRDKAIANPSSSIPKAVDQIKSRP